MQSGAEQGGVNWVQVLGLVSPIVLGVITAWVGWVNNRGIRRDQAEKTLGDREASFRDDYLERLKSAESERDSLRLENTNLKIENANLQNAKTTLEAQVKTLRPLGEP
jgi:hypothetical protein